MQRKTPVKFVEVILILILIFLFCGCSKESASGGLSEYDAYYDIYF